MIQDTPITYETACGIEPALRDLEDQVRASAAAGRTAWRVWEQHKRRLRRLVGWNARHPRLAGAYDVCYRYLLNIFEGAA
jgi:hypothetical protein